MNIQDWKDIYNSKVVSAKEAIGYIKSGDRVVTGHAAVSYTHLDVYKRQTRDYVRGMEVVLANGDVITVGSKNVKDASGLSLKNLIVGSEGTLAVITKCILKLIPKPKDSLSVLVPYPDIQTGTSSVLTLLKGNVCLLYTSGHYRGSGTEFEKCINL